MLISLSLIIVKVSLLVYQYGWLNRMQMGQEFFSSYAPDFLIKGKMTGISN